MSPRKAALIYLDTNVLLDLVSPRRNNPRAHDLLRLFRSTQSLKGVVSSLALYEAIDTLQQTIYQRRALDRDSPLEEARKFRAGPFEQETLRDGATQVTKFLTQNSRWVQHQDPEINSCWVRAQEFAQAARFEATDLGHLAMAMGVGACALATNDESFFSSLSLIGSRRLGFTPVWCNPKVQPAELKRVLKAASRRAEKKHAELEQLSALRAVTGMVAMLGGTGRTADQKHLVDRLDAIRAQMKKAGVGKR